MFIPLAFTPSGDALAVSIGPGMNGPIQPSIRFINPATGAEVRPPINTTTNQAQVQRAAFSPDGKWLACHYGTFMEVIDAATGARALDFGVPFGYDIGIAARSDWRFSPDSKLAVAWSGLVEGPRTVSVWEIASRKERFALTNQIFPLFSADSRSLLTVELPVRGEPPVKTAIHFWNAQTGELEKSIQTTGGVTWSTFAQSPDGRFVALAIPGSQSYAPASPEAGREGPYVTRTIPKTVGVFDVKTRAEVFRIEGEHPHFLADGKSLLIVSGTMDAQVWDIDTRQLKRSHRFDLSSQNGRPPFVNPAGPQIAAIAGHRALYPRPLRWLAEHLHLNIFGVAELSTLDVATGMRTRIELQQGPTYQSVVTWAPDGHRFAFRELSYIDFVVHDIPPRKSLRAFWCAIALAALAAFALRRKGGASSARPAASPPAAPAG
jgi:WD40 repeat protein